MTKENEIPRLNLEQFIFTPPGPMGWSFEISEEEIEKARFGITKMIETEEGLDQLGDIYELGINEKMEVLKNVEDSLKQVEIVKEEEIQEDIIKIILPIKPLKGPWLSKKYRKK